MSRYLIRLLGAAPPLGDVVPDAELLRRFTAGDAAAFELLVRRHAPAVWAACLRVLRNDADAHDAFQTTFLVLAKKAAAVRGACAGGWLHRVAVNASLKLRARRSEAGLCEAGSHSLPASQRPASEPDDLAAVHEELARLPERYRLPVVLCDLEGQSRTEAARSLGWPLGSVNGRLARARDLLRDRLARRGFAPVVLVACAAPTRVVQAALSGSAVSPVVSSLAEGVLSAMRFAKLKVAAVLAVGLLGLAGIGAVVARSGQPVPPAAKQPDSPKPPEGNFTAFPELALPKWPFDRNDPEVNFERTRLAFAAVCPNILGDADVRIDPADDTLRRILKEQLNEGRREIGKTQIQFSMGRFTTAEYIAYHKTLRELRAIATELWASDPKTLAAWLREFVVVAKDAEAFTKARVEAGTDPSQEINRVRRHRLEAEAALWKAMNPPKR